MKGETFRVRRTDSLLVVERRVPGAWFAALCGVGMLVFERIRSETPPFLLFEVLVVFFIVSSVYVLFWQESLRVDFARRKYSVLDSWWPWAKPREGSLDEIAAVELSVRVVQTRGGSYSAWDVGLRSRDYDRALVVGSDMDEKTGFQELERLSKELQVPAVDRTGSRVVSRPPEEIDAPVRSKREALREAVDPTVVQPPDSEIRVEGQPGNVRITLPPAGFSREVIGVIFACFVFVFIASRLTERAPVLFGLVGLACLVILGAALSREFVAEGVDEVRVGRSVFGVAFPGPRLRKRGIEDIDASRVPTDSGDVILEVRRELRIRSDEKVARLGRGLTSESRDWLRRALLSMATRG